MNIFKLLSAALGSSAFSSFNFHPRPRFRNATPSARRKGLIDKSDLPHGYPGAKLVRRAMQKGVGVKHHGLRQLGVMRKNKRGAA